METTPALACLSALSHAARLEVFRLLVQSGPQGLAAGEIARRLDLPPSTLSTHLSLLEGAGLLAAAREGRVIRYTADLEGIRALIGWLLQDCCGGAPETCAPILEKIGCACSERPR